MIEGDSPTAGVKLRHILRGHTSWIGRIAWSPDGRLIASPSGDGTVKIWDASTAQCIETFTGHHDWVNDVKFHPSGRLLVSACKDHDIRVWDLASATETARIRTHCGWVDSVAFNPDGTLLASASGDHTVRLWDVSSWKELRSLASNQTIGNCVTFNPDGTLLAAYGTHNAVQIWDAETGMPRCSLSGYRANVFSMLFHPRDGTLFTAGSDALIKQWDTTPRLLRSIEGHTDEVKCIALSPDGRLLASKGTDDTVRLWRTDTGACAAVISEPASRWWPPGLVFHPSLPLLATVGSDDGDSELDSVIHIWHLDFARLLDDSPTLQQAEQTVKYATAKIVLVGNHSVGKSALAHRLVHGDFRETSSTHGQQIWLFNALSHRREDGTQCEAILWDLAGQPDYRLIHALSLDDTDCALILFNSSELSEPLSGVEYWLKQLCSDDRGCRKILVGAQTDRGTPAITLDELQAFCQAHQIADCVQTSARTGEGVSTLIDRMNSLDFWNDKSATVTTSTFKRIKDHVLLLKQAQVEQRPIVRSSELRARLQDQVPDWQFTDSELHTAVRHLEHHGYVKALLTSEGDRRVLLIPELLNNLAASMVLAARRNPRGLGALEERSLLGGGLHLPEMTGLRSEEQRILLDAAVLLFLKHNICFRETDPLNGNSFLCFPELINLKTPRSDNAMPLEDDVAYTVVGKVENVYAALVVLMGYTQTFKRTGQWQSHAQYEVGDGLICGFKQEGRREGELDFVLFYGTNVPPPIRMLFQGLFESLLDRQNVSVTRYEIVRCPDGHVLNRSITRDYARNQREFAFCPECGKRIVLPGASRPVSLPPDQQVQVAQHRRAAERRTAFEQAIFRLQAFVRQQKINVPTCFISYAWGVAEHERWVETNLAADLQKAGIAVILDRWENSRISSSVPRFVDRIEKSDRVLIVGTPEYRRKYENKDTHSGFVVAAEVDLIANRLLGTELEKESVLPLLLAGEKTQSFPPLLHSRVYADFRSPANYFATAFDVILSLYGLGAIHPAVRDLRESLQPDKS